MKEDFPIFLWKYQVFSKHQLFTCNNDKLTILDPGSLNQDAGPDFSQAKININGINWYGDIEVHVNSSQWKQHKHHHDRAYNKVILHVVWEKDGEAMREDNTMLPTLELKPRVSLSLLARYKGLLQNLERIPCASEIKKMEDTTIRSMIDRTLVQRLEKKTDFIYALLNEQHTWEEVAYRVLAKNFGFKVNAQSLLRLSEILPWKLLRRHGDNLLQVEALLMGMAGFLSGDEKEPYFNILKKEYLFLCHKYKMGSKTMSKTNWKFFRTRPVNFPTIRIAQFAQFCYQNNSLFSIFKEIDSCRELLKKLEITQSEYWRNHYYFGKKSHQEIPCLGEESMYNIVINSIVPLKMAYGKLKDEQNQMDAAIRLLEELPPENNRIIRIWKQFDVNVDDALDSQGLIELFQNFCLKKKCLNCNIGISILKTV